MDRTLAELTPIFRDLFVDDRLVLSPATTAEDVDGWDSLSHTRLVMEVERHFGVSLPMDKVMDLQNVGELVILIEAAMGRNN